MGKTLKIHPLTIIFILLCAGNLMGIVGVIIGIPHTLYLRYWFHTYLCYLNEDTIATMEMMLVSTLSLKKKKELNNNIYNFRLEQQNNNVPVFLFLNHIHLQS